MSLIEIASKYDINGLDKDGGTDKNSRHFYFHTYERILAKYIDKKINILEIGVQHGGSILLWNDFLPHSNIIGIDIQNIIHSKILDNTDKNRLRTYLGDAYSDNFIATIKRDYIGLDVVIDDGPHTLESQILCLIKYLPILNNDGVLAIEDVQSVENLNTLKHISNSLGYTNVELVDTRHINGIYDDLILIVKKW